MATFKVCIFDHQKRRDGKYPVSIRLYWKGKLAYIGTEYYVTDKQILRKKLSVGEKKKEILLLKDVFIFNELNKRIAKYEDLKAKKLGYKIEMYSAKELAKYFLDESRPGSDTNINFIEFSRKHIQKLLTQGRVNTAKNIASSLNSLIDFINGRENLSIAEITSNFLQKLEDYLRGERTMKRKNQFGKTVTIKRKGLSDVGVIDFMTNIRLLFNAAMREYNDEDKDEIRIIHYPFRKYKLKKRPVNEKRNLSAEQIRSIIDMPADSLTLSRAVFSRDVFLLSFYLVGMNFADLYEVSTIRGGRLEYERKKTKTRRQDKAFISIKIEPEAEAILSRYIDKSGERVFDFHKRYTNSLIFSSNVNKGLKVVAKQAEIAEKLSTYYARHSWATIARNKCSISKDDVELALNHVDKGNRVVDMYIEKDWSMIDTANRTVLDYIRNIKIS